MPDVLETLELRWFADGEIPASVMTWFEDTAPWVEVERRVDSYLVTGRADLGVKRRDHGRIEVKERRRIGASMTVGGRLVGRVEEWHKHVDDEYSEAAGRWLDINKTVTTYRYRAQGAAGATSACDVELATVEAEGTAAWTLALEASGPRPGRRATLRAAFEEFVSDSTVPSDIAAALDFEAGYPAWLIQVVGD